MNPALQGYTAAVAEAAGVPGAPGGADLERMAADLEAIEQLVLANGHLRAALSDTAVPGPARRAVLLDLLDGKVVPAARRLAAFAAGAVPAPEVAAALGWLATRTRHLSEGLDEEPGLSLTQARARAGVSPPRCTRTCRTTSSSRSRTTSSGSRGSWRPRPRCAAP